MDKAQLQLTQEKLMLKAKLSPKLLRLDEPVDPDWLEAFEAERNIDLPWDYREIILNYGDGGYVPDVLSKRYWRPLEEMAEIAGPLDALFLPTAAEDVTRLPGVDAGALRRAPGPGVQLRPMAGAGAGRDFGALPHLLPHRGPGAAGLGPPPA